MGNNDTISIHFHDYPRRDPRSTRSTRSRVPSRIETLYRPFLDPFWTPFGPLPTQPWISLDVCIPGFYAYPPRRGPQIYPRRGPKRTLPNREVLPPKMTLFWPKVVKNRRILGKKAYWFLILFFSPKENPRSPCVSKRKPHCISARARGKSLGYPFWERDFGPQNPRISHWFSSK